jgi:hypothetical protein
VIGRDPYVRRPLLDHLEHRVEHTDHGAKGRICALVEASNAVEMAE